jgi:hypothetical protein
LQTFEQATPVRRGATLTFMAVILPQKVLRKDPRRRGCSEVVVASAGSRDTPHLPVA